MAPQYGTPTNYISGIGKDRGDLFTGKLLFAVSKNVSGHFIFAHFIPGNYYLKDADYSSWTRMESFFKFQLNNIYR